MPIWGPDRTPIDTDGLAGLDDLARPFMARGHRVGDWDDVFAAIELVVGVADADRAHAHEDLIGSDRRCREVLDLKFARLVVTSAFMSDLLRKCRRR